MKGFKGSKECTALVDIGAAMTVIDKKLAEALDYEKRVQPSLPLQPFNYMSNELLEVRKFRLKKFVDELQVYSCVVMD